MTIRIQSVCVLCGSRAGSLPAYGDAARRLGRLIAVRGARLIYGGGSIGLMGIVADSVMAAGGSVIGIIPEFLVRYEVGHKRLSELIVTDSMQERKRQMFELSDGFVILPGGLGTLDEAFEIITWKQLRLHSAPIVVLDVDGYWAPLQSLIEAVIRGEFAHPAVRELFTAVASPEEVFPALESAPAPQDIVLTSHL
jgi:hypothetical protein